MSWFDEMTQAQQDKFTETEEEVLSAFLAALEEAGKKEREEHPCEVTWQAYVAFERLRGGEK